ncbi:MAG: AAA family ATPase [Acidimicrobiaceae bacterium]|nr:AAA family ATPase [Acidimicrobiaceae bacterium]
MPARSDSRTATLRSGTRQSGIDLLDRRLIFVTGKGGVGKTTVASALALLAAERGSRTLLCEVDAKGNVADFFDTGRTGPDQATPDQAGPSARLGFAEREVLPNLWAMSMDTEASLQQYLRLQLKMGFVTRVGPLARMFDFVASAAPGVREIVTVGKLCWEVRERHYDLVVVDAAASGHIVSQLTAPQAINELVKVGPIRAQTGWMLEILGDPAQTAAVIVATPAEMPVRETLDLARRIRDETNVTVGGVVVNRVLPELFGRGEEEVFEQIDTPEVTSALEAVVGGPVRPILDAARLMVTRRRARAEHLTRLREEIDPTVPLSYVPYLFFSSHGLPATREVAAALSAELGY